MTTDEYVPHESYVRHRYVSGVADVHGTPEWEGGEEFSRFLTRVRRDAYDEGYQDAQDDEREHRPWRKSVHPYRQEQTNE